RLHLDLHSFPTRRSSDLKGLDPDLRDLRKVLSKFGQKVVCYAFALEAVAPDAAVHARGFAPDLGIEDPATGSAAGSSIPRSGAKDRKSTRLNSSHVAISY